MQWDRDTGVGPLTTYYYWVTAGNGAGSGPAGSGVKVTTYQHWTTIENQYQDSIVKIKVYTSILGAFGDSAEATGWFAPGGYIVTNWHAVKDWNWVIDVYLQNDGGSQYVGQKYHAAIVALDQAHDLAILKLKNGWAGQALSIGGLVSVGEPVAALGHPGGEQMALTTGTVQMTGIDESVANIGTLPNMVRTDIGIVGGSSGSPVFNHWGQVVGIIESADRNDGNISYFVPVAYLAKWGIAGTSIEGPQGIAVAN